MAKKKITKQSKRRLLLFGTISVILVGYFLVSLSYYTINIYRLKKEEKELTNQLEDLKHDEKLLKNEIEKLKDKDYLARYARENYAYSKEGELVLKIQKEEEEKKDNEKIQIDLTNDYFIIIGSVLFLIIIIYVIKKSKRKKS